MLFSLGRQFYRFTLYLTYRYGPTGTTILGERGPESIRCILTLDRAVKQRFSAQNAPVKISGSSHVVERKCVGIMKWYMQMPTWIRAEGVSVLRQSHLRPEESNQSQERQRIPEGPAGAVSHSATHSEHLVDYPWLRSRRSAEWGFEDNTAWYGQKKKLWVNMAGCPSLPPFPFVTLFLSLSHRRSFDPFWAK